MNKALGSFIAVVGLIALLISILAGALEIYGPTKAIINGLISLAVIWLGAELVTQGENNGL